MPATDSPWALPATAATRPLALPSGHVVQAWAPAPGESHRLGWYEPAAAFGRLARERGAGPLDLDDIRFLGRVDCPDGPTLWVYRCPATEVIVLLDVAGQPHQPVDEPRRRLGLRFEPIDPDEVAAALGLDDEPSGGGVVLVFRPRSTAAE
jgi:hypothetical protein